MSHERRPGMFNRAWLFGLLALLIGLLFPPAAAMGATDAKLSGTAKVKLEVQRDDLNPSAEGETLPREYKFKSKCGKGPCSTVQLDRELRDGSFQKLTLKRLKKGIYEYQAATTSTYWCERNGQRIEEMVGPGSTTVRVTINKADKKGAAKTISVDLQFVKAPYTGFEDAQCAQEAAQRGLEIGQKPEEIATGKGRF